ncbi:hypothetical protein NEDG_00002 [Nematocida displodere]|uniref:Uncharacterized protein n=1 Tax=Nematocida displodere TaxID=1805483 RepID=A0A177EHW0_9MICR|nr:hypothetical protein NEDG_00002 [Nematocida displodere]
MIMESNPVTSFGKVCKKIFEKTLWWPVLCLGVFCMGVSCADEVYVPEYITSLYTEQTMEFFERSCSDDWSNALKTVEKDGQRCLLKDQTQTIRISPEKYTLETVPAKLVEGIEFDTLIIRSSGPFDLAVLEKTLSSFGTINAYALELYKLDNNPNTICRALGEVPCGASTSTRLAIVLDHC